MIWLCIALLILSVACAVCIFANEWRKAREDNPYHSGEAYDPFGMEYGDMPATPITDLRFHGGDNR